MLKLADVQEGDILVPDAGFICVPSGTPLRVERDTEGLFFTCSAGKHYLDGQENDDGTLSGLALTQA